MTNQEKAKEFFGDNYDKVIAHYLRNGYVYSGADAFALARPYCKDKLLKGENNVDKFDCWFIQYVCGDMGRLLELLSGIPLNFEWIVFERSDGRYRAYRTKRLMEKFNGKRS